MIRESAKIKSAERAANRCRKKPTGPSQPMYSRQYVRSHTSYQVAVTLDANTPASAQGTSAGVSFTWEARNQ